MKKDKAIALSCLFVTVCAKYGAKLVADELTGLSSAVIDRSSHGWKALRVTNFDIIDDVEYFGVVIDWKDHTVDVVPIALLTGHASPLDLTKHTDYYNI
jgi:hypothetical protein